MWELDYKESWAPKNWCFWTVVLEKTLESPLDCKEIQHVNGKGNQSWIFIKGQMLKLKLQYFGHVMWRTDSLEKTLMLGEIEGGGRKGRQRWDGWMASPIQLLWVWASSGSWWWDREAWRAAVHGVTKSWTWLSNWTELNRCTHYEDWKWVGVVSQGIMGFCNRRGGAWQRKTIDTYYDNSSLSFVFIICSDKRTYLHYETYLHPETVTGTRDLLVSPWGSPWLEFKDGWVYKTLSCVGRVTWKLEKPLFHLLIIQSEGLKKKNFIEI